MYRKFIALILASALAVSSLGPRAAQAADAEDVAKLLAGLTALAIIGAAVSDRNDNNSRSKHKHGQGQKKHYTRQYNHSGHGNVTRHKQQHRNHYALPGKCRTSGYLQGHKVQGFRAGCLQRNHVNVNALPRNCALRYRDQSQNRSVTLFTQSCLRQQGYHVARY